MYIRKKNGMDDEMVYISIRSGYKLILKFLESVTGKKERFFYVL